MESSTSETPGGNASAAATLRFLQLSFFGLGIALLFLCLCFGAYVYKQNKTLTAQVNYQKMLLSQTETAFEKDQRTVESLVQDLTVFAQTHQDIVPILVKYGFVKVQMQQNFSPSLPSESGAR